MIATSLGYRCCLASVTVAYFLRETRMRATTSGKIIWDTKSYDRLGNMLTSWDTIRSFIKKNMTLNNKLRITTMVDSSTHPIC